MKKKWDWLIIKKTKQWNHHHHHHFKRLCRPYTNHHWRQLYLGVCTWLLWAESDCIAKALVTAKLYNNKLFCFNTALWDASWAKGLVLGHTRSSHPLASLYTGAHPTSHPTFEGTKPMVMTLHHFMTYWPRDQEGADRELKIYPVFPLYFSVHTLLA